MKRLIIAGGLGLALASAAPGGPLTGYTNNGAVTSPPVFDYTNFVNNGLFDFASLLPFKFPNAQTYTNRGVMYCEFGFIFDTPPAGIGDPPEHPAAGFSNQNPGQIYGGAEFPLTNTLEIIDEGTYPQLTIEATNITSSGVLDVGQTGNIDIIGDAVDLSHGTVQVESFDQLAIVSTATNILAAGIFDDYWGTGMQSNRLTGPILAGIGPPTITTPLFNVTNNAGTAVMNDDFIIDNAQAVAITNEISPSNIVVQVIFYGDSLGLVPISGAFEQVGNDFANGVVGWSSMVTNNFGQLVNNTLYLTDDLGQLTKLTEQTNGTTQTGRNLLVPTNYTILNNPPGPLTPGNVPYSTALFTYAGSTNRGGGITNVYAALGVSASDVTVQPDPNEPSQTYSNVPGRVEITANTSLDMTSAAIYAGNYLGLFATNHYAGSPHARITFPYCDLFLGSTNGQLTITNLVPPYLPRFTGTISCYSAIWTNLTSATNFSIVGTNLTTNIFTVSNRFLVLYVSSALQPTSPVYVDNLSLRSTNVVISDLLNVTNNLLINAQSLTITSNAPGTLTPEGELNLMSQGNLYSVNWPVMENLTNSGLIEVDELPGAAYFQLRQNPNGYSDGDGPWQSVVNHGDIESVGGNIFWANNFANTGTLFSPAIIYSEVGPITVQSATALLTNGEVLAAGNGGDMSFTSGSLTVTNHILEASGSLSLYVTNLLTDLSAPADLMDGGSSNEWEAGDGFSLYIAPASGDLLGTIVENSCLTNVQSQNTWAGIVDANISATNGVYTNLLPVMAGNAPLGQLILNGGDTNSVFHFRGPDTHPYALYVDQIQLQNGATNYVLVGGSNVFTAFNIDTNVTIYYLDAVLGNLDISQKLYKSAPGRLVWLSNYVGRFSYTNITYPDGRTFAFNRALAQSDTISSSSNGIPNGDTSTPFPEPALILTPQSIGLVIALTNAGASKMVQISWNTTAYSTNTLYARTLSNTNWQVRTNFTQGAVNGRVTVFDSLATNRLYKVGIVPFQ